MVIFPDIEAIIVAYLKSVLGPSVYVATKKPTGDDQPEQQVIIKAAYNGEKERMIRFASLTIEVFALGDIEATNLALLVEAYMREFNDQHVKKVSLLLGAVRLPEESQHEKRGIDIELIIKGFED